MSALLVNDLERLNDPGMWRDFAPALHLADVAFLRSQHAFDVDAASIENGRALLNREGYFQIPPPNWGLPIPEELLPNLGDGLTDQAAAWA